MVRATSAAKGMHRILARTCRTCITEIPDSERLAKRDQPITIRDCINAVRVYFALDRSYFITASRHAVSYFPRHVAMHLARSVTGQSYPKIGGLCGGVDHTTVMFVHKKLLRGEQLMPELHATVEAIRLPLLTFAAQNKVWAHAI